MAELDRKSDIEVVLDNLQDDIRSSLNETRPSLSWKDTGKVISVLPGVVFIEGLASAKSEEIVEFENGSRGIIFNIDEERLGCVMLSQSSSVKAGMEVISTGQIAHTIVSDNLLGRVIDPMGKVLDSLGVVSQTKTAPVEGPIVGILERASVTNPLETGIKVIDTLIPIGKGQRELILGDRQTGKTSLALDIIINQKGKDVICIYCAIGQRTASVASAISALKNFGALEYTIFVVAEGNSPPGIRFVAPYAATTIAEYFMNKGRDVLIVYDDLTNHARAHREISLLLRRPPGREAYPGDIFYVHSRLLERSTHLGRTLGGGSLTALPIIETQNQDISAYIPTNLISITDGQICLSNNLFQKNILPAVDIGLSVSRVGGKAQLPAFRAVASDLKLAYSQYEELETFSKFGTKLDPATKRTLAHGARIRACFNQSRYSLYSSEEQIIIFLALKEGLFDSVPIEKIESAEEICKNYANKLDREMKDKVLSLSKSKRELFNQILKELKTKLKEICT